MKERGTSVHITSPDGSRMTRELDGSRLTVGRSAPDVEPDIVLEPDPYRLVSRVHCVLGHHEGVWTVTDNASDNGTLLRRQGEVSRVLGSVPLRHGDSVLVLGDITADDQPRYWKLTFDDPFRTEKGPVSGPSVPDATPYLKYDWLEMKAYRVEGPEHVLITGLSPQGHKLIRYMAKENGGSPVACTNADLIEMMWGPRSEWPPGRAYDETNLRNIVNATRQRIERDPKSPRLLQLQPKYGYHLEIRDSDPHGNGAG